MNQKGISQQTAVLFMLLLLAAAFAIVAPRLGQVVGPRVASDLPVNAPVAAEPFDYEQAADNFAARWVATGQGYERLGMLNTEHAAPGPLMLGAVVLGMADALSAGNLDKLMAYWAEDATFYIFGLPPNGSELLQGREALRAEFTDEIANHQQLEVEIETVKGDIITTREKTWHDFTRQIGVAPLEAIGVYQIKDGQIANYAWTLTEASVDKIQAALAEMPAEAAPPAVVEPPVSAFTVTFTDGTCRYDGPLALQAGDLQVTMDVQDGDREKYGLGLFTLEGDKEFMDLMASTSRSGPPSWAKMFFLRVSDPGTSVTTKVTAVKGPIYAVCFSKPPDIAIGNVGPFEVVD